MAIDLARSEAKEAKDLATRAIDRDPHHHSVLTQDIQTPAGKYPAFIILAILGLIALRPDVIGQYLSR